MRRECEIKFLINDLERANNEIKALGYKYLKTVVETDLIIDTKDRVILNNGALFRLRIESNDSEEFCKQIVTFKAKNGINNCIQDNIEIEFDLGQKGEEYKQLIEYVYVVAKKKIAIDGYSIKNTVNYLQKKGLDYIEVLQKKRLYFTSGSSKICVDRFNAENGDYLEIETYDEKELWNTVDRLHLDREKADARNYGEIFLRPNQGKCYYPDKIIYIPNEKSYYSAEEIIVTLTK